ncbi:MAG: PilZ domain-containing protein [Pseudomonadota bacterium]
MSSRNIRRSKRYSLNAPIDVSLAHKPVSYGTLIDISRDGVGFLASPTLTVGGEYLISIRGFGAVTCKILHCTNFNRYGAAIIMSDNRKKKLALKLENLPEAP